jgi:predicted nucleotidyltransferase
MDKKQVLILAKQYADEVLKVLTPEQILLFGSYSTNTAREDSDIDIAVIFDGFEGNYWETATLLCKLTRDISFYIEPHLLDKSEDKSGFVEHVIKTGEIIYNN